MKDYSMFFVTYYLIAMGIMLYILDQFNAFS